MITLSNLFARLTAKGRRELKARKWDTIADRQAQLASVYGPGAASAKIMGASTLASDHFELRLQQCRDAEDNARKMAAKIRRGEG